MNTAARFMLLIVCGAAGIGAAVYFASLAPPDDGVTLPEAEIKPLYEPPANQDVEPLPMEALRQTPLHEHRVSAARPEHALPASADKEAQPGTSAASTQPPAVFSAADATPLNPAAVANDELLQPAMKQPQEARQRLIAPRPGNETTSSVVALGDLLALPNDKLASGKSAVHTGRFAVRMPATATAYQAPEGQNPLQMLNMLQDLMEKRQAAQPGVPGQNNVPQPQQLPAPAVQNPQPPAPPAGPAEARIDRAPNSAEGDDKLQMSFRQTDLRDVLHLLSVQSGLNILASPSVQGNVSAALNDVDVQTALDAILKSTPYVARRQGDFIYVGSPQDFQSVDRARDHIGMRVYRPHYVTAAELSALIQPILSEVGKARTSLTSPSQEGIPRDAFAAGGDDYAQSDALLVQDYETVLLQCDQIVAEIDQRPAQVSIESMILSVRLDDSHSMGIDWQFLRNNANNVRFGLGTPSQAPFDGSTDPATGASANPFSFTDGGLTFAFLDDNLGAFVNALEQVGDTNVIATPRLMCLNKQRAEIHIGAELGFRTLTQTETSTTENVEFLEVGTQLRLRPFVSPDGMVRLEVHPELSTGQVVNGLPEKELTQVTTNIMVRDGSTVIIGGLMREDVVVNSTQVPLFGSLPYVGPLFRNKTEELERREILVLLTPRIVRDGPASFEGEEAASEFYRRQGVLVDKMSPIGKRYLARKMFRRAQAAWAHGERHKALRYINLAIHLDPQNRAQIDLRSDIWEGRQGGTHSGMHDTLPPQTDVPVEIIEPEYIEPPLHELPLHEPLPLKAPSAETFEQPNAHRKQVRTASAAGTRSR